MNQKIIQQIGRSQRIGIINLLKRSEGMAVAAMAEKLDMSYMGVKQHCLSLHRQGYLTTKRAPQSTGRIGRPELFYILTQKSLELFPEAANPFTISVLEAASALFGATAGEKLLFKHFQNETTRLEGKVKGETPLDRAKSLAKLRDAEGYYSELVSEGRTKKILEHHSPIMDLLGAYPVIAKMEEDMFRKILRTEVKRTVKKESGQYQAEFTLE
jgi:predicted ArsR family transcriptional regulator